MKKLIKIILITLLTIFSFYYTDKAVELSKKQDPLMIKISSQKIQKEIKPVNAKLDKNTLLVGTNGRKIDIETSYNQMKKINEYNDNLLNFIEIKPDITQQNNLDKLIIGRVTNERKISIIFKITSIDNLQEIAYILNQNNTNATFFIDTKLIEQNKIKNIVKNNTLGFYTYDNTYKKGKLKYTINLITNNYNVAKYCLYENKEFLSSCISQKINTIKPILIEKDLYNYLKTKKENGLIYQVKESKSNIKQLNSTIKYLKQKGYKIEPLEKLLKE